MTEKLTGGFTIPGESGQEALTLALADRWGADVIRDSDGTKLSPEIVQAGHGIYSTICLIREDLPWAKAHPQLLQQNFLMSQPVVAIADGIIPVADAPSSGGLETTNPETTNPATTSVTIDLLAGYSKDQFVLNDWDGVDEFWQVHDRTTGQLVPREQWQLVDGKVTISSAIPGHTYTVNFLVMRIWEEISMYNHITNNWGDREHLVALEPRYPEVAQHILDWLDQWCIANPDTTVVRFTSLFYNFAWFWGSDANLPHIYADWGSYDFTVNPIALREFKAKTGLDITAEDFINAGRQTSTHNPPSDIYRAWMEFTWEFVLELGKKCVEIVHRHGKKAYVFYDDSWVGLEPFSGRFDEFGFDGIIKAVFSGYEARLAAAVEVPVHEIRLHPYLFPVDLEGKPTFAPGGDPTPDLLRYWVAVRRALLRARVDRIGLGGYLSLVEPFPEFQDAVADIADQHRLIRELHLTSERGEIAGQARNDGVGQARNDAVGQARNDTSDAHDARGQAYDVGRNLSHDGWEKRPVPRVGVITAWGELRTWTTSGHLHENKELSQLHVLEALAGLGFAVSFHSLKEIAQHGVPSVDVLLNAGPAGSAWSGGSDWSEPELVAAITNFVAAGGGLLGVEQPSAVPASKRPLTTFALAQLFGVDQDTGDRRVLARRHFDVNPAHPIMADAASAEDIKPHPGLMVLRDDVQVLAELVGLPTVTATKVGNGRAVYLANFRYSAGATRLLENAIYWAAGYDSVPGWRATNPQVTVAPFPAAGKVVAVNDSLVPQTTELLLDGQRVCTLELAAAELATM